MQKVTLGRSGLVVPRNGFGALPVQRISQAGIKLGEERGKALGIAQTVKKYIGKRWKEHVTETQLLKDLKSYFGLNEKEARQYMTEALAKV